MSTNNTNTIGLNALEEPELQNVFIDTENPNTAGTVFEPDQPQDAGSIYLATNGALWIWNGTEYISKDKSVKLTSHGEYGRVFMSADASITLGGAVVPIPFNSVGVNYGTSVIPTPAKNALLLKKDLIYQIDTTLREILSPPTNAGQYNFQISFDGVNWANPSDKVTAYRRSTARTADNTNNQGSLMFHYQPSQDTYVRVVSPANVGVGTAQLTGNTTWLDAYVIGINESPMSISDITATASRLIDGVANQTLKITFTLKASASGWLPNPVFNSAVSAGTAFSNIAPVPELVWVNAGMNTVALSYTITLSDDPALNVPDQKNGTYTVTFPSGAVVPAIGIISASPEFIGRLLTGTATTQNWTLDGQQFNTNTAGASTLGAYPGYTIRYGGNLGGSAGTTIAGPATDLGGFTGGGTVTILATQPANRSLNVQTGAVLNLGEPNAFTTEVGILGTVTVQSGAVANWWSRDSVQMFLNVTTGGTFNINGNAPNTTADAFQLSGTTVNGTLNISNARVQMNSGVQMLGTGTVNINKGANFYATPLSPASVKFKIAGTGTGVAGTFDTVLQWANNLTVSNAIEVVDDAKIAAFNPWTYTGQLTIPAGKTLTIGRAGANCTYNLSAAQTAANITGTIAAGANSYLFFNVANYASLAKIHFPNVGAVPQETRIATNQTFVSASAAVGTSGYINLAPGSITITNQDPAVNFPISTGAGSISITGGTANTIAAHLLTGTTTVAAGAGVGGATATTGSFRALTMAGATSRLVVNPITASTTSRLGCTAFAAASGFKVDITGTLDAGTYTILTKTSGATTVPTIGVNSSGKTATFAWVGNNLNMTLA